MISENPKSRYFLHLSFAGQFFRGWQNQKDVKTVQETIEKALSQILKEELVIFGCGRTDALVHATQYFAHFDTTKHWDYDLIYRLNKVLPHSISIHSIHPVSLKNHARYHANKRVYHYFLHTEKIAHIADQSTLYTRAKLDFEKMTQAVQLIGTASDFLGFCKTPDQYDNTICQVQKVQFYINSYNNQVCFEIACNRFLRGMIRNLMSKIILVGKGEISLEDFRKDLMVPKKPQLPIAAPPQGLHLTQISYPFLQHDPLIDPLQAMLIQTKDSWLPQL